MSADSAASAAKLLEELTGARAVQPEAARPPEPNGAQKSSPPSAPPDYRQAGDGPVLIDLREIAVRSIDWWDRPFLPRGELVVNAARGGTGKGLVSVHYAARLSRGELGDEGPRMCVFAVAEDAYDSVFKPRLLAAGADLEWVRALRWRRKGFDDTLEIPTDLAALEELIVAERVALLVVDPLLSHLGGKTDSYKDHEVKRALTPLGQLAQDTGCTILGNLHLKKDVSSGARGAVQASSAFTDVPRVAWAMVKDPDPDREGMCLLEVIKSNVGPEAAGRDWRIDTVPVDGLKDDVPRITPEGASTRSVDDLLRKQPATRSSVPSDDIRALILCELASGAKARKYLDTVAHDELGVTANAVYERGLKPLKDEERIKPSKSSFGGDWHWKLIT